MKKITLSFLITCCSLVSFAGKNKDAVYREPLFQIGAGTVYSCIDLTRYTNSVTYRGLHFSLVTHLGGRFFLSTEYSTFPVHTDMPSWDDVTTNKIDINPQFSFSTENRRTHISVFTGVNRHEWRARRTAFTDVDQLGRGLAEGTYVELEKWGMNFGCGFTAALYENLSVFGDYRFCFRKSMDFEKVRIVDVMTTIGLNFSIPHPDRKKKFGIGKKIYKWTEKGAQ